MNAVEIITLTLKTSIFLTALGFGLNATPHDALYLFRKPGQLARSMLAMNLIMPLVAFFITLISGLAPLVKVALIAISVSPLPPLFLKKSLKAGGRQAYVIGLMVTTSLFSVVLIPLTLNVLSSITGKPVEVSVKTITLTILATVIVPLFLGISLRYFTPIFTRKIMDPVARFAQILLVVSLIPILLKVFPSVLHLIGNGTVLAIAAFVVTGILVGHFLGGSKEEIRSVLALATASRHPGIVITLASGNLPDHKLVPAAILLYLLINALADLLYKKWVLKHKAEIAV